VRRLRDGDRSAGFTLPELIVAMAVGLIVLIMVGTGLILITRHQQRVVDTGQSSAEIQDSFTGIQRGVRNATPDGVKVVDSGRTLVVLTGGGDDTSTWRCQAWKYVPGAAAGDSGTLYSKIGPQSVRLDNVTDPKAAGWTVAVAHVTTDGASPVFTLDAATGAVKIAMVASRTGRPDDIEAVRRDTEVLRLPQAHSGNGGCFA
jgi:prepilin-type N-terminal cleavage/methylation domain-containing protein